MATIKKYNGSTWENAVVRKYGTASEIIVPPTTIYADGTAISTYTIKGNTVQDGTPTPSNPVAVNGVGERTENLCLVTQSNSLYSPNYNNYTVSDYTVYATGAALFGFIIPVSPNTTYTCYSISSKNSVLYRIREYSDLPTMYSSDDPNYIAQIINQNYNSGRSATFTTSNETTYILFAFYVDPQWSPAEITNIMLVQGSTAPTSYIPYGYKIPISSANTTPPVYLGEVETTRKIGKKVLTENLAWTFTTSGSHNRAFTTDWRNALGNSLPLCTHYEGVGGGGSYPEEGRCIINSNGTPIFNADFVSDKTEWLAYLQQQYAAGTPVTLWYVLTNETTGTVNEPLMKIGDYADTLSNAASIPTTDGANTITVDTTVQPSEFTATWKGWHDSSVQEYQGGVGNQKFDKSTAALGYRVLYTTGEIGELSSAFCSDFIPVVPNTTYTLNVVGNLAAKAGHLYALYDSDKEFVDTGTHASVSGKYVYTFTIPSGIAYIRFNGLIINIDETMLNEGETALPYEPYEYGWV